MTKRRAALSFGAVAKHRAVARRKVLFITLGGPKRPSTLGMTKGRVVFPFDAG
jgi:hypothetical protein